MTAERDKRLLRGANECDLEITAVVGDAIYNELRNPQNQRSTPSRRGVLDHHDGSESVRRFAAKTLEFFYAPNWKGPRPRRNTLLE